MKKSNLRIISGRLKGRKIAFDVFPEIRPTTDRIRETLFNWLQPMIVDRKVLDCFAGSGILGFESLSRGARKVTWVDRNKRITSRIASEATRLKVMNTQVICEDVIKWLASNAALYDLLFLDPPYQSALLNNALDVLQRSELQAGTLLFVEYPIGTRLSFNANWKILKVSNTSRIEYQLLILMAI